MKNSTTVVNAKTENSKKGMAVQNPQEIYDLFQLTDKEVEALRNDAGFIKLHSKMKSLGTVDIKRIVNQCIARIRYQSKQNKNRRKVGA